MKTQTTVNRKKSMLITLGVHSALLLAAMIPVTRHIQTLLEEEQAFVIPIEFAQFAQSNDASLAAASEVKDEEVKPVTEDINDEPEVIEAEQISEVTETTEEAEPIESEVVEEVASEVVAAEDDMVGEAVETTASGGNDASSIEGESAGTDATGEEEGQSGLDGTGVITRKIIHREDISQVARYNGIIAVNLCIDRRGYVTAVAKNDERTTIKDMNLIRQALDIATGYRFEKDYGAALRECGVLTFVFEVDTPGYEEYVYAE